MELSPQRRRYENSNYSDFYLDNGFPEQLKSDSSKPEFRLLCEIPSCFKDMNQVVEVRLWFDVIPSTVEFKDTLSSVVPYKTILKSEYIQFGRTNPYIWGDLMDVDIERGLTEEDDY